MALGDAEVERLKNAARGIRAMDQGRLVSRPEWGTITFESAASAIQSIYEIATLLEGLPIERLMPNAANPISDTLEASGKALNRANTFSLTTSNPVGERDQIVAEIKASEQNLYQHSQSWIPFLAYLRGDVSRQLANIEGSVSAARTKGDDFGKYIETRTAELEKIIQASREASAKAGVAHFTQDFANEAIARDTDAGQWLTRATLAAVVTLGVAIVFFFIRAPELPIAAIQYSTSKVVILAMLIAVTAWCAGNYKANKHQSVINRHKAHALATFQAFVQASDNPHIRDAVLMETTRSIFSHVQTGYLKADGAGESSSQVVEIIKSGTDAVGSKG